jgi:hypothetical protein
MPTTSVPPLSSKSWIDYALAAQTALNVDALQPFAYASPAVDAALSEVAASRERLEKRGP